jgi:NAD(P)H-hydrate epimerase
MPGASQGAVDLRESHTGWRAGAETVWLPTAAEMAALDAEAVASGATTERTLIEAAGREIAHRVHVRWPQGRVLAVAGRGHNGADALVALRTLQAWGRQVVAFQAGESAPEPDVMIGWSIPLQSVARLPEATAGASVLIDGLLGTGLAGPPREPHATLIEEMNGLGIPVCAVDGPSGADFTTGAVEGACVRATVTVSLGWPKIGLLRYPAREYCGDLEAVEIGFPSPARPMEARAITGRWVARMLPSRPGDAHKGRAGYLALVAGQKGMAGATVLSARAALRGGIGILKVVSDPSNREVVQEAVPGAIFVPWDDREAVAEAIRWSGAAALGPGLGRDPGRRELLESVLSARHDRPVVVDADGLSVWEGESEDLAARLTKRDVITPHPGELARLLGTPVSSIVSHPAAAAREAADRLGCAVLLKGTPSVIAVSGEPMRVSTVGGPALAAGGTGDVLTGLIGSYLGGGMPAADAAAAAMFISGLAAEASAEPVGHVAADLPDRIPEMRSRVTSLSAWGPGSLLFASPAAAAGSDTLAAAT